MKAYGVDWQNWNSIGADAGSASHGASGSNHRKAIRQHNAEANMFHVSAWKTTEHSKCGVKLTSASQRRAATTLDGCRSLTSNGAFDTKHQPHTEHPQNRARKVFQHGDSTKERGSKPAHQNDVVETAISRNGCVELSPCAEQLIAPGIPTKMNSSSGCRMRKKITIGLLFNLMRTIGVA